MTDPNIPQIQTQQNYAHMRAAASASPPVGNGVMPYHPRQHTPQPQMGSRPASRNHNPIPRPGSTLGQVTHAPSVPNGYAYMPNHGVYNPHAPHGLPGGPHPAPQHPPQPQPQYQPQYNVPQMQQQYMQDPRRQSVPPYQTDRLQPQPIIKTDRHSPSPPQQQQEPERRNDNLQPQQPKPLGAKSRSIYTPIDNGGSLLAQHWGMSTSSNDPRPQEMIKQENNRSQSVDVASVQRTSVPPPTGHPPKPQRVFSQPQRTQSITSVTGDGKRPRLKVQIPSEHSDEGGSAGTGSSPRQSGTGETPAKNTETSHSSSGVVLPPPSPSASALLSAGAQGPPNPFARPLPPNNASNNNSTAYTNNNNIETPISALPSRFLQDGMLPSPSSFYPGWDFGRSGDSNMLPSPLNFQTPVQVTGPSFGGVSREDSNGVSILTEADRKRKSPESEDRGNEGLGRGGPMQGGGGGKRIKAEI